MREEKPTIILIESDYLSLSLYQRELSASYNLSVCHTEAQASAIIADKKVDLIIMEPANGNDWGWDFGAALRQNEATREIPVIFCTTLDERKKAMQLEAAAYLIKPVYAHVLRQHVQTLLKQQEVL